MAEGLPNPKSREQILSEMLTEYVGLTGINDLNTGSVITQFFDVVARSVARTSGDIFQILRDYSVDRATGEALNRIGEEERVYRQSATVATGKVVITDTSFEKIATKIYSGAAAPNVGSSVIKVSDASNFPGTGVVYIGRGTPNIEGPLSYSSVTQVGSYWEINLTSPTQKFHNISESVILGQGGTRTIPAGTVVASPGIGTTPSVNYNVASSTVILDGENINENVQVVAQEPGSLGNAPIGAIREFTTAPFANAAVINEIAFSNGLDLETDDDYRDRIKRARLSKGLGTALAVKNAVLGAQAKDENARVTSNEIDTTNPENTILYVDNGEGYEEKTEGVGLEYIVDSAIGGEQNFQLVTGGNQTSVAKAFLKSSESAPFNIYNFEKLSILVGGIISEHTFLEGDFQAPGAATAYEVVASINNNTDLLFEATTADGGKRVVIQAKSEDNEYLKLTTPSVGVDAAPKLGLPSNEVDTLLLYKNKELLNKNGRPASILSQERFNWSNTITDGDTLIISVDGTDFITYTIENEDFIEEGQHPSVSPTNTLSSWVNVLNNKITGVTAEVNGQQIKLTSNLGTSNRAAIEVDPSSTLVIKGMFSEALGLSAQGNEADFELSRNTAQIKLNKPLVKGDSLNLGSEFTRAELESTSILGGQVTLTSTAYLWLLVDDPKAESVRIGLTSGTFVNILKPGGGIVRYQSLSPNAFSNVQVGDYVIISSPQFSAANRLEGRVNAVTSTTLDLRVTASEEAAAVAEGPVLFSQGFTVVRTDFTPQKIKIDPAVYNINAVASIMNEQLTNAVVSVENDEFFIIRTHTEDAGGALFIIEMNDSARSLNFTPNSQSQSITSQFAYYESGFKDRQFPAFIHAEITTDTISDPPTSFNSSIVSSENLSSLNVDPSGFICFSQAYNQPEDVTSTECVEIESFSGSTINIENSVFYRRSRVGDRYHVLNGYDFGHEDIAVAILDDDASEKTFILPLYRTAVANASLPIDTNNFRAYDQEGGLVEFEEYFGDNFLFDNYKVLMQAKNGLDPLSALNEDAILFRAKEWGRSGEKIGVGYFYPTAPSLPLSHVVTVGEDVKVKIFLKSGPARLTTADGTTEWNVTIVPLNPSVDLVTYAHSGIGTAPGLGTVIAGDYVTILNTGEFSPENIGSYRVESATASSFTIRREVGKAVIESNISSLENTTISFFESDNTTAQEIETYVNTSLSNYISAELLDDNGLTGAGIISRSTAEDSDFSYELVYLLDGKNFILESDLDATIGNPQFIFKNPLDLPSFSTNTPDAYSFNGGEVLKLIPITSIQVKDFLNILAVTGFSTLGTIKSTDRNTEVQLSSDIIGSDGALQIVGGTANLAAASIEGSASAIGDQDTGSSIATIPAAASTGFHSDQWVKVEAAEVQKKATFIDATNTIELVQNTPGPGFSKIILDNKSSQQRFFGNNRFHTRTRGRTFRIEKQGQFVCISWDENGTQPYFLKNNIDVNDSSPSTITIFRNGTTKYFDITVDTGNMRFDEVDLGDIVTIDNRLNEENNGNFIVYGKSSDCKTIRVYNENGINELASGTFTITNNVTVLGDTFTIGATTLTEGVDFVAGPTLADTALNLAAAIALLPNISASSNGAVVNIESDIPNVIVALSTSGGGATASGAFLEAPVSNTGDLEFKTEVEEGDTVEILSDFNILNQGIFTVIRRFKNSIYIDNPNVVEEEITLADQFISLGSDALTNYDITKTDGINTLSWAGAGASPSLENARPGDTLVIGTDFAVANQGEFTVIGSGSGFVNYININGVNESNITISDVLEIHREAIKFKNYEGTTAGDIFVISNNFLGAGNAGKFIVEEVLSESEIIVNGSLTNTGVVLLDANFNKVYIEEEKPYVGYKKISLIATSPANANSKNVVFDTPNQFEKINELNGVTIQAMSKFSFPSQITTGIDSYRYHTGLIAEANRIVYGDPRDNTTYPGVAAAGAEIFIKAPLVRRIQVSINIRIKTGVPFTTVVEEVRNSVSALINSNPIGQSIAISDIVSEVNSIIGVQAVAISSPQYDSQNDVIRINSGEKAFVLDAVSDILVLKID